MRKASIKKQGAVLLDFSDVLAASRTSQLRTLRSIFQQMDQDNDGRVSLAEFKLHVRDSTLEKMAQGVWRRLDHSGCGLMSFRVG